MKREWDNISVRHSTLSGEINKLLVGERGSIIMLFDRKQGDDAEQNGLQTVAAALQFAGTPSLKFERERDRFRLTAPPEQAENVLKALAIDVISKREIWEAMQNAVSDDPFRPAPVVTDMQNGSFAIGNSNRPGNARDEFKSR